MCKRSHTSCTHRGCSIWAWSRDERLLCGALDAAQGRGRFCPRGRSPGYPAESSLCLFRVLQEALHNAVRHSGVRQFGAASRDADTLSLTVRDTGLGFDPENAIDGRGLGLTSMKERLKLVGGELLIASGSSQWHDHRGPRALRLPVTELIAQA